MKRRSIRRMASKLGGLVATVLQLCCIGRRTGVILKKGHYQRRRLSTAVLFFGGCE